MSTINVLLPDQLQEFVDSQVRQRGYGGCGEYVRELIQKDLGRAQLRGLLLDGAASPQAETANAAYFEKLRRSISKDN